MASTKTKFNVGIFVILGFVIGASVIIYFGLSGYLEKGKYHAVYFDESVQGLDKDSAVKYRGVTVGRVDAIDVAPDDTLIRVVLKIEKDIKLGPDMVAQLKSIGITGIMFVELDKKREGDPDFSPKITFESEFPVVGTRPSELKKYMKAIENVLNQLNSLDVKGISDRAKSTLDTINQSIETVQVKKISENIRSSLEKLEQILDPQQWNSLMESIKTAGLSANSLILSVNDTVANINNAFVRIDGIIQENEAGLSRAITDFTQSMERAGVFLGEGADLIKNTDKSLEGLQRHLMITLQNLEQTSRHLNRSVEQIADQPSLLIFSKPLPERTIGTDQ